jgi:hypothetical protein
MARSTKTRRNFLRGTQGPAQPEPLGAPIAPRPPDGWQNQTDEVAAHQVGGMVAENQRRMVAATARAETDRQHNAAARRIASATGRSEPEPIWQGQPQGVPPPLMAQLKAHSSSISTGRASLSLSSNTFTLRPSLEAFALALEERPGEISGTARRLAQAIKEEIARATPPNDDKLDQHRDFMEFLRTVAVGLTKFADAIDAAIIAKSDGIVEPALLGQAGDTARELGTLVQTWFSTHSGNIVDYSMRIGLIGLGYKFLSLCGVQGSEAVLGIVSGLVHFSLPTPKSHRNKDSSKRRR